MTMKRIQRTSILRIRGNIKQIQNSHTVFTMPVQINAFKKCCTLLAGLLKYVCLCVFVYRVSMTLKGLTQQQVFCSLTSLFMHVSADLRHTCVFGGFLKLTVLSSQMLWDVRLISLFLWNLLEISVIFIILLPV